MGIIFVLTSFVVAYFLFQALQGFAMHWALCLLLTAAPIALTFFFGLIGLLGSAIFTGALFKASA